MIIFNYVIKLFIFQLRQLGYKKTFVCFEQMNSAFPNWTNSEKKGRNELRFTWSKQEKKTGVGDYRKRLDVKHSYLG